MNSLSWLIYGIQLVGSVQAWLVGWSLGLIALCLGWLAICGINCSDAYDSSRRTYWAQQVTKAFKNVKCALVVCVGVTLIVVFLPNRQTLLLIAGSEIGERMINNQAVQSVVDPSVDLLKTWIAKEVKKLKKGDGDDGKER